MSNLVEAISGFGNGANNIRTQWELMYTDRYMDCYWEAWDRYKDAKSIQDKLKFNEALLKFGQDMAYAALAMCGAHPMAAIVCQLGVAGAKGIVTKNFLCQERLQKTLSSAGLKQDNSLLEFSIGKSSNKIKALGNSRQKLILNTNSIGVIVFNNLIEKPQNKKSVMDAFLKKCQLNLKIACEILCHATIPDHEKELLFNDIKRSYFCTPPNERVVDPTFADRIELAFYLKLVLNSDTLVTEDWIGRIKTSTNKKPIKTAPDSPQYPDQNTYQRYNKIAGTTKRVEYDRIGQTYISLMNKKYRKVFKTPTSVIYSDWFGERTSKPILDKAQKTLEELGRLNHPLVLRFCRASGMN